MARQEVYLLEQDGGPSSAANDLGEIWVDSRRAKYSPSFLLWIVDNALNNGFEGTMIPVMDRVDAVEHSSGSDGQEHLRVKENGEEFKFGQWANDLVDVGRKIASIDHKLPTTLAISLPILDFASSLIAAGYVAQHTEDRLHRGAVDDAGVPERTRLFNELCSLPSETPVLLRQEEKTVHAVVDRVETLHGENWVVVRFQTGSKGAGRVFINGKNVHKIIFSTAVDPESAQNAIGKVVNSEFGLARAFIHNSMALAELILRSSADCALIGINKSISDELRERVLIGNAADGARVQGTLQDIVRVSLFLRADDAAHTELYATRSMGSMDVRYAPKLAIFRGASAYIYQARKFLKSHHVVLLSPTERNFADAVAVLNEAFLHKVSEIPSKGWKLPQGLNAMGFQRRPAKSK